MRRSLLVLCAVLSLAALHTQSARAQHRADAPRAGHRRAPARPARPAGPCLAAPITIVRVDPYRHERETRSISLTRCNGRPNLDALETLSLLARARGAHRPTRGELRRYARDVQRRRADAAYVAPDAMRVDAGLLLRVQAIAARFPGRPIELVSGFRPRERESSRHRHAKALDLRVVGISRERLRDFARTLDRTGVGYYPNSVFVHVDVRDRKGYWVDRSGPGEPADYGTWPPSEREQARARTEILELVTAALQRQADDDARVGLDATAN